MKITNPATGEILEELKPDSLDAIHSKYLACRKAQKEWAGESLETRKSVIQKFQDILQAKMDSCAQTLTSETGKPLQQAKNEIKATLDRIAYFVRSIDPILVDKEYFKDASVEEYVSMEPLGVIGNISAWNYPYFVGTNVFIPALLAGNGVLYKPSEHATLTGRCIKEIFDEAGLPSPLFSLIEGDGTQGRGILEQAIDGIFFTGSYRTGLAINLKAAEKLIPVGLELGGKDPCYVTEDTDVAAVAPMVADGAFYNTGQSCCSVERIYVHEKVYDKFLEHFMSTVKDFKVGLPMEEGTYIGPLTRQEQIEVLKAQIEDALQKGAKLEWGGQVLEEFSPHYFAPTVLTQVNHSMLLMQDESFGPIIGIQKVKSDEEACELMNDTTFGLTSSVYCRDQKRAKGILEKIDSGTVYTNCCDRVSPYVPWSGRRGSGIGSTLGEIGMRSFLKPKSWQVKGLD